MFAVSVIHLGSLFMLSAAQNVILVLLCYLIVNRVK